LNRIDRMGGHHLLGRAPRKRRAVASPVWRRP
jgi:hypothetical protein